VGVNQTAAWYKEWNKGTAIEGATYIRKGGHHVGHRPTFLVTNITKVSLVKTLEGHFYVV